MTKSSHILIVAGDPSGDLHGAALARALKQQHPGLRVTALGGTHLRAAADAFLFPLVELGGFGFWEPLFKLPKLLQARRAIRALLKDDRPQVVIPIDFYGFNIHVARLAHSQRVPVVYYISPQVWASRPHRVHELSKAIDKMLVIFPFEEALYRNAGVAVRFVGHPLIDRIPTPGQPNGKLSIGLLPGSRRSVAERHLPIMVDTARELRKTFPDAEFILFRPQELGEDLYHPYLAQNTWLRLACDPEYQKRRTLSLAITVSGTAALENTLLGIPMIVMYKLSGLTYAIAKRLIRVPFIAIPNLLAEKALVPELLQSDATPEKLSNTAQALLKNPGKLDDMRRALLSIRTSLGQPGSTQNAAEEISPYLV